MQTSNNSNIIRGFLEFESMRIYCIFIFSDFNEDRPGGCFYGLNGVYRNRRILFRMHIWGAGQVLGREPTSQKQASTGHLWGVLRVLQRTSCDDVHEGVHQSPRGVSGYGVPLTLLQGAVTIETAVQVKLVTLETWRFVPLAREGT